MALLTVQNASDGAVVTLQAAAAGGDQIPQGVRAGGWGLSHVLLVRNAAVGAMDVTVAGMTAVNVPASGTAVIPVFGIYQNAPRNVTYSAVTSVTVAAVKISGS